MKKTTTYCAAALAALCVISSCKEEEVPSFAQAQKGIPASFAENKPDESIYLWKKGDRIAWMEAGGTIKTATYKGSTVTGTARFAPSVGEVEDVTYPLKALYPAAAVDTADFSMDIPSEQMFQEILSKQSSVFAGYSATGDDPVMMHNLFGGLAVNVKGNVSISRLSLRSLDGKGLCGAARVSFSDSGQPSISVTGSDEVVSTSSSSRALSTSGATTFLFAIPTGEYPGGFALEMSNRDGSIVRDFNTEGGISIAASSVYTSSLEYSVFGEKQHGENVNAGKTYSNSVCTEEAFAEPVVIRAEDGYYYAFSSGNVVPMYRSFDMISWEKDVDGLYEAPSWSAVPGASLKSPDVHRVGSSYNMYYAMSGAAYSPDNGIGLAVSQSIHGPYTDVGKLVVGKELFPGGNVNVTDPAFIDDGEGKYLFFGSFQDGIYVVKLNDSGTEVDAASAPVKVAGSLFEGAEIYKKDGWYYLFASTGSATGGLDSQYCTVVGRSQSITGPYLDRSARSLVENNYSILLQKNTLFGGPGQCSHIVLDDDENEWIYYQGFAPQNSYGKKALMLDRLEWDAEGWPVVNKDGGPTSTSSAPVRYEDSQAWHWHLIKSDFDSGKFMEGNGSYVAEIGQPAKSWTLSYTDRQASPEYFITWGPEYRRYKFGTGSADRLPHPLTLSTDAFEGKIITSVSVFITSEKANNTTLKITVGDTEYFNDKISIKSAEKHKYGVEHKGTGNASGTLQIELETSTPYYFNRVEVHYKDNE